MAIESRTVLLEAIGDTRHARRELERLEDKVRDLDGESEVSIRAETTRAQRRIGEFEASLKKIDRQRVSPEVSVELGKALADLAVMRARLTALGNSKTKVDIEMRRNILREVLDLERGILRMSGALEKASRPARTFGETIGNVVQSIKSVTPVVNGLAILIGIKLVSGLLAVGVSAAAAVGGIFALGSALLASLGPAVALAIAVVSRLAAIFDVMAKQKAAADQAKAQALSGSTQNIAAAQQEEAAARSIADAHREAGRAADEVSRATVAAYEEMEQAAENVQEAVESVANANLDLDQARLDVKKAEEALKDFADQAGVSRSVFEKFTDVNFQFDQGALQGALAGVDEGDRLDLEQLILDVRKAKQGEKDATDDLSDSERSLATARKRHAEFLREGINASPAYVAAVQAQKDAQRSLRRAIDDAKVGTDALIASQANAIVQAGKLSAAERRLLAVLTELKPALRDLFGGATNAVIGSLAGALDRMKILFLPLKGAIGELGLAWADLITTLSKEFIKPAWIGAFMAFFHLAAQLTKVVGGGVFIQFLRIIRNIALVAGPMLVDVFKEVNRGLAGVASSTSDLGRTRSVVAIMVNGFRVWLRLIAAVVDMFVALIEAVGPIGNEFIVWITDGIKAFTKWLRTAEGQQEVREFFEDTLPAVKSLIKFIFTLVKLFLRFLQITSPVLKGFIDGLTFFLEILLGWWGILQDIVRVPIIRFLLEMVGQFLAFGTVGKVIRGVFALFTKLPGVLARVGGSTLKNIIAPFEAAFNAVIRLISRFAPRFAARLQVFVLNAVSKVTAVLGKVVGLGRTIVTKIGDGIRKGASAIFDFGKFIFRKLGEGIRSLFGTLFGIAKAFVERLGRGFGRMVDFMLGIGKDLLSGLIKGFTTIGKKVFDAIRGLVGKIVDAVKDFLGIHSPSRVMMNIGQQMLAGLIKGFTSGDVVGFIKDQLGGLPGLAADLAKAGLIDLPINLIGKGLDAAGGLLEGLPGLAKGGIVTSRMFAELGENGKEAVVPLTKKVLGDLANAIASSMTFPAASPNMAMAGGSGALRPTPAVGGGVNIAEQHVHLPAPPAGGLADPLYQARQLARLAKQRGR